MVLDSYVAWRKRLIRYLIVRKKAEFVANPPYRLDLVAHFRGHWEYSYGEIGQYPNLSEAIKVARQITEDNLALKNWEINKWRGMGDAGLVYDAKGNLVWSGVIEYGHAEYLKNIAAYPRTGLTRLLHAIDVAVKAHSGQVRKGTSIPFIVHPLNVAGILLEFDRYNPPLLAAAVLHDTLEDTAIPISGIRNLFGKRIAGIVETLSGADKNMSWEYRKAHTINRLKDVPLDVLWVECADKLDNIRTIHNDYNSIGEKLWDRFNLPKENQSWYYQSLAMALSQRKENDDISRIIAEFTREVDAVFSPKSKIFELSLEEAESLQDLDSKNDLSKPSPSQSNPAPKMTPLNKIKQEKSLTNPHGWHDLALYCSATYITNRIFHPSQGYDASRRFLCSKDIYAILRSCFPDVDEDLILYVGRQIRKIIKNLGKKGTIMSPGVYH